MGLFHEVKCGRCDRRYSSIRSRCPYCGARKNRDGKKSTYSGNSNWKLIFGIIILLAIIVAVIILISNTLKTQTPESTPTQKPGQTENEGVADITPEPADSSSPSSAEPTPTTTEAPLINSIVLNRTDFTLSKIGEEFKLEATLSPAGSGAVVSWVSEDPSIATVSSEGVVKAVNKGVTTITAAVGSVSKKCTVRVSASAPAGSGTASASNGNGSGTGGEIKLSTEDATISGVKKESFTLSVTGAPGGAAITYSSDDSKIATVDDKGRVTAVSSGKTEIKVTVNGTVLTCLVRVK